MQDVLRWPEYLPHYRFVREAGKDKVGRSILEMSAWCSGFPVTWTATFECQRTELELRFEHILSWTKGMKVQWTLTPTRDGTRIEIVHAFAFRFPPIAWLVEPIVGRFFVRPIARQTLDTFKAVLEGSRPEA